MRLPYRARQLVVVPRNQSAFGGATLIGFLLIAGLMVFTLRPFDSRAAGAFNPVNTSTYSSTDPVSHPDIASSFALGVGADGLPYTADDTNDYAAEQAVGLSPSTPQDSDIPDGAILGSATSMETLGILNNRCTTSLILNFTMMEATTDNTNTVEARPFTEVNNLAVMAGDGPPYDGVQDVKPPPAVTKYPSFLNAIFDPDWVDFGPDKIAGNADDNNGPQPALKPLFRAVGATPIPQASDLWVILQVLVFDKGTKLPNLPAFDPAFGYPEVTVFQQSSAAGSATPPAPGPITDSCTPMTSNSVSYGITRDNLDTPADEGGIPLRTLPPAGTQITTIGYLASQRDADGDGYENALDPCPFNPDTVWDPRAPNPQPADNDLFAGIATGDGIPDTCDPSPTDASPAVGGNPNDYDGDGFPNRGDNCPLIANSDQRDVDDDDIGDACDPNPSTPDGAQVVCYKIGSIVVGGDPNLAFSPCLPELPVPSGTATPSATATQAPTATPTGTPEPTPTATATPVSGETCEGRPATKVGTDHRDLIIGTNGPDVIVAKGGDDIILGLGGNDVICAGSGNDLVVGGAGDDRIFGEDGDDLLVSGRGEDFLNGGDGADHCVGSPGDDTSQSCEHPLTVAGR